MHHAGLIVAEQYGQKVIYRPNIQNPFYEELCCLVAKHLGFHLLTDRVLNQVGTLVDAFVVGDYAKGLDSGTIEVALVGNIEGEYLAKLVKCAEEELVRKVKIRVFDNEAAFKSEGYENVLTLFRA